MASLVAQNTDYRMPLETEVRSHWLVGRDPECEILLSDKGISRCHATLVYVMDQLSVIDHSLNGTHVLGTEAEIEAANALETPTGDDDPDVIGFETCEVRTSDLRAPIPVGGADADLHRSHHELRLMQRRSNVPRMIGYNEHAISSPHTLDRMLESFQSDMDLETLASMGRPVRPGDVLLFVGFDRHLFRYEEGE